MSKFKCTWETEKEIANGPLTFSQLENLTYGFVNETLDLQQDFKTKAAFVHEQFIKVSANAKEVEDIFKISLGLQQQILLTEIEFQILESKWQRLKNLVENLELFDLMQTYCVKYNCSCSCEVQRQKFLELLLSTNSKIQELPKLLESINDSCIFGNFKNPYADIFAILDCHCETLKSTERNVNAILDKISIIQFLQQSF